MNTKRVTGILGGVALAVVLAGLPAVAGAQNTMQSGYGNQATGSYYGPSVYLPGSFNNYSSYGGGAYGSGSYGIGGSNFGNFNFGAYDLSSYYLGGYNAIPQGLNDSGFYAVGGNGQTSLGVGGGRFGSNGYGDQNPDYNNNGPALDANGQPIDGGQNSGASQGSGNQQDGQSSSSGTPRSPFQFQRSGRRFIASYTGSTANLQNIVVTLLSSTRRPLHNEVIDHDPAQVSLPYMRGVRYVRYTLTYRNGQSQSFTRRLQ